MIIKLLVEGGNMKPNPAVAQKIGPLGLNMGKIIQEVNEATKKFSGLKVPVELDIDTKTKNFTIRVSSPPVAELIKRELSIEKGSGEMKKLKVGNLAIEQVIKIAKTKMANMLAKDLKAAVKSVAGSCQSLGVLIESKEAKEIEEEIKKGTYDKEIEEEKIEPSPEKLEKLKSYFESLKAKQEEIIKKEEEAKDKEEEAKTQEAVKEKVSSEEKNKGKQK